MPCQAVRNFPLKFVRVNEKSCPNGTFRNWRSASQPYSAPTRADADGRQSRKDNYDNTPNMRTYDDTFSGQRIYPGKVRCHSSESGIAIDTVASNIRTQPGFHRDPSVALGIGESGLMRSPHRASYTFVATAKSSAFRTARPSPFSSSARTLAAYHGLSCSAASTRRASLRFVQHGFCTSCFMVA